VDATETERVRRGEVKLVEIEQGRSVRLRIEPLHAAIDVGSGPGKALERQIIAGQYGLLLDGRYGMGPNADNQRRTLQTLGLMES